MLKLQAAIDKAIALATSQFARPPSGEMLLGFRRCRVRFFFEVCKWVFTAGMPVGIHQMCPMAIPRLTFMESFETKLSVSHDTDLLPMLFVVRCLVAAEHISWRGRVVEECD